MGNRVCRISGRSFENKRKIWETVVFKKKYEYIFDLMVQLHTMSNQTTVVF